MPDAPYEPTQRLHPMSWIFGVLAFVRQLIVPLIVAAIFGSRGGAPTWIGFAIVPLVAAAVWKQIFYRYGLGPAGLVIRDGVFFHNVRQIDYSRIENIDTERGPLHRLLGVAELRVETSTGGKPEALIQVLGLQAAEALRQTVFANRGEPRAAVEQQSERRLLRLPVSELVKFGLIDNRGMIVVAGLFGLLYESGAVELWGALLKAHISSQAVDTLIALGPLIQAALALVLLAVLVLLVRSFSVLLALVTLYDFTLTRAGPDLRVRYGLLTRVSLTLRVRRIQAAHATETLLHRLFRRVSVRVDLAGSAATRQNSEESQSKIRWLAPLVEPNHARLLMAHALPDVDLKRAVDWQPLAPGARRRVFKRSFAIWSIAAVVLGALFRTGLPLALLTVALPISYWYAAMYVRYTRWALHEDALFFRHGWLTRKLAIVPRNRVQVVCVTRSPFDRRHAMASIRVDTAGAGAQSDQIRIRYLQAHVARELAMALYASAAESELDAISVHEARPAPT